jgi:hypothetical protein
MQKQKVDRRPGDEEIGPQIATTILHDPAQKGKLSGQVHHLPPGTG